MIFSDLSFFHPGRTDRRSESHGKSVLRERDDVNEQMVVCHIVSNQSRSKRKERDSDSDCSSVNSKK